jgi:choline kinase
LDPSDAGLLIMNSDVLFHPLLLQRLLADKRENVLLADFASGMGEEEMKIRIDTDYRITAISKLIDPVDAQAENLGVLKVGPEAGRCILELARVPQEQNQLCWIPDAINYVLPDMDFFALNTGGLPWIEIDYHHDLQRAREHILPAIESLKIP